LHLLKKAGKDFEKYETYYLPLIALATVADVCPLVGENRTLTSLGLELMPSSEIPALDPLIKGSRKPGENSAVTERDLAFGMAPIINTAGRMGDPFPAAKLILAKDVDSAWEYYRKLSYMNNERKKIQARTIERLSRRPEVAWSTEKSGVLAVVDEDCTPGLAGLAAARLAEITSRPTCILAPAEDGKGKIYRGSIRTSSGENLLDLLAPVDPFVEKSGGHKCAMGITVRPENLADFMNAVERIEWMPSPNELILDFPIDSPPGDPAIVTELESTRPWGEGNPEPAFQLGPAQIKGIRTVGKNLDHVQISLKDGNGAFIKGIGFSLAKFLKGEDMSGKSVETAGHFIINSWQGRTSVEIRIADFEFKDE
ncbi:MAG: DHHA1 domain-containing protein, partial [bacterium]